MGLCKCPKRKVTNQFCFEHRVNVCENCMVTNHPKCVIQSYLQWLQDSDCNPICTFCEESLSSRECCRLTCYHVYHWSCLDSHCRSIPESKNSACYLCPACNSRIIPQTNLVSPVADVLRAKLAGVNWARAVQGLPLLSYEKEEKPEQKRNLIDFENSQSTYQNNLSSPPSTRLASSSMQANLSTNNVQSNNQKVGPPYSIVNMESSSAVSNPTPRRVFEAYDNPKEFPFDHDENKYQRKSPFEWFARSRRLFTRISTQRRNTAGSLYKRYATFIIAGIGIFIIIIMIFSWLGKMATDNDSSFDPVNHPMINIEKGNQIN